MFIVIEGLDGTGKSTIAKALAKTLNAELLATPDTSLKKVRPIIDDAYESQPLARQLFYASTVIHLSEKIKGIIKEGETVVVDRYWLSTQVYHSWKCKGQHLQLIEVEKNIQPPDLTVYLTLPLVNRILRLGDRMDNTPEDNLTLTKEADDELNQTYKSFAESNVTGRWLEVDVTGNIDSIVEGIMQKINTLNY